MKKMISTFLILVLALSSVACGNNATDHTRSSDAADASSAEQISATGSEVADDITNHVSTDDASTDNVNTDNVSAGKTLVVYYSATGSTKAVAQTIADVTGADLFEIIPVEPYTDEDLNWTNDNSRVNAEHNDESKRDIPLTNTTPDNWEQYDTVYVGYPIWWAIAAWPVNNFVKNNDFTGKTVVPFCTSASSGIGQSGELLEEMAGTGTWLSGERFSSGVSADKVEDWVNSLDL